MAAAAKPAATTRERRIELIFDIIVIVLLFYFGVIDPAQAWISVTGYDDQFGKMFHKKFEKAGSEPG
jgi:hypothetical protein